MTTTQQVQITAKVNNYQHNGHMTAGYMVAHNDEPVFIGTFNECAQWGSDNLPTGAMWIVRDARGVEVGS